MTSKLEDYSLRPSLNAIVALGRPLVGAEVGVLSGDNSARMLANLPIEKLYLVDSWIAYRQNDYLWDFTHCHKEVVARFVDDPRVEIVHLDSIVASGQFLDGSLDFVYIDACHEEESVKADVDAYVSKIKRGGILAGHDFSWPWLGTVRAVLFAAQKYDWTLYTETPDWWTVIE